MIEDTLHYVPLISDDTGSKWHTGKFHSKTCGIFTTYEGAINGLIENLVLNRYLSFDKYCDMKSDYDSCDSDSDSVDTDVMYEVVVNDESDYITHLKRIVDGWFDKLCELCKSHGDSYYQELWTISISEHYVRI
jgi:hypothetical protein